MNGRALSEKLGLSHSAVSHWETGKRIPSLEDVASFLGAIGVTGKERERILELARHAAEPNWLTVGMPGVPAQLAGVVDCETDAERITEWSPALIPGLLQTAAHARAILQADKLLSHADVESRLFVRMGRREIRNEDRRAHLHALVGETALREPLTPPEIRIEQLRYLLRFTQSQQYTLQVVRSGIGWHPGLHGPFVFYEFPDSDPVIHFEHFSSGAFVEDEKDVIEYRQAIKQLTELAMTEQETATFIDQLINEMEKT